jgi:hypothetical protein
MGCSICFIQNVQSPSDFSNSRAQSSGRGRVADVSVSELGAFPPCVVRHGIGRGGACARVFLLRASVSSWLMPHTPTATLVCRVASSCAPAKCFGYHKKKGRTNNQTLLPFRWATESETLNPTPYTLNPKPNTPNPEPRFLNLKPSTIYPKA